MAIQLIVALDFENKAEALALVEKLDPGCCALKVGSEMFTLFGPDFITALVAKGFKVFLDLKFHDIPNQVAGACKAAAKLGVWMINVHASGGSDMMKAAKDALIPFGINRPLLIAVTVLTSMSEADLYETGINGSLEQRVLDLARKVKAVGLDGVVSSAHEVAAIKKHCGADFITVTPGIRLGNEKTDDQTRIMTPTLAIKAGSDYLVIGRPITAADDPAMVMQDILRDLL